MHSNDIKKSATFNDLSVDLVYVIFSYLQSEKAQLRNLALTCQTFRQIAQRFIVRDASISHSVNGSRTKLFLRTLIDRPDLVVHVHRLELDLLREDIHWPEEQQTIHKITRLLTNLREFCYLSRDYKAWHYSVPLPLKWARERAHDQVRRVEWHHNMAPWELRKCMELPNIETIRVRELQDDSYGRFTSFNLPARKHGTSSLVELCIGSPSAIASEALQKLLHMPRCLRKITFESRKEYQSVLEPNGLVSLLQPVRECLEELHVEIRDNLFASSTKAADLAAFSSIKNLTLPFRYIFGPRATTSLSQASTLLPPQLSTLKILFVSTKAPIPVSTVSTLADNRKALYQFLNEVDRQKGRPQILPDLTHITLQGNGDHKSYRPDLESESLRSAVEMLELYRLSVEHRY